MSDRLEQLKTALSAQYEIDKEVGQGGMANVYLARDVKHNRQVAVKVLRPELATALGPDRFLREIEIAANLMHPHILPLFDSGEADGFLYYVMPFVDGDTLRQRVEKEGELPVAEAVRLIREVVDALAFAHSHGVVHRDIKPDNVMLSGSHAMVTDFGVAKAVSEATGRNQLTTAGVALGTPSYMSPEQATADPHVDHRADIYAIGAMAYELLTGRPPFIGHTPQAILAAHVTEQVEPVSKHRDQVSPQLESVIMKCLAKKPADRWQTAEEILPHLETLATSSGGLTPVMTMPISAVAGKSKFFNPKVVVGIIGLGLAGLFGTKMLADDPPLEITISNQRQLTSNDGLEYLPDLSPDGNDVVYLRGVPLVSTDLFVRNVVVGGNPLELVPEMPGYKLLAQWGPDGQTVRFVNCGKEAGGGCAAYAVSRQGGTPTAISRSQYLASGHSAVFGLDSENLVSPELEVPIDLSEWPDWHSPAWTENGERLAFVDRNSWWLSQGNIAPSAIWVGDMNGGEVFRVTDAEHLNVSPVWLPDSRYLLFISDRDGTRGVYVVKVGRSGADGEPRLIPGVSDPHSISLSADGKRLVYSRFDYSANIWSMPMPEAGEVATGPFTRETSGNQTIEIFSVSADGDSLLFDSGTSGNQDIYKSARGDENPIQLTTDPANDYSPSWSPDGSEVVFYSLRTGFREIFVMPASPGGVPVQVTNHEGDARLPVFSPDALTIVYGLAEAGGTKPWMVKRSMVGGPWGEPEIISATECSWPSFSPDGKSISCTFFGGERATVIDLEGTVIWEWEGPRASNVVSGPLFLDDGSLVVGILPVDEDVLEGWRVFPRSGAEPSLMLRVPDRGRNQVAFGGGSIFLAFSEYEADLWVMDLDWED